MILTGTQTVPIAIWFGISQVYFVQNFSNLESTKGPEIINLHHLAHIFSKMQ